MNPKLQAAQDLQRFAGTFKGILALAEELTNVGSLEQARDEAQKKLDALNAWIKQRNAEYDVEKAKRDQEDEAKKQHAEDYLSKERALAETVQANAKEAAGKMLAEAHAEAKVIIEEARAVAAGHLASVTEHKAALDVLKVEHASKVRDLQDVQREHFRMLDIIKELKAKFDGGHSDPV